jgi:hypothetical protein
MRTVLFAAAIAMLAGSAQAADVRDGHWWSTQPYASKLAWTAGFFDGVASANQLQLDMLSLGANSKDMPDCTPACIKKMLELEHNLSTSIIQSNQQYPELQPDRLSMALLDFIQTTAIYKSAAWMLRRSF